MRKMIMYSLLMKMMTIQMSNTRSIGMMRTLEKNKIMMSQFSLLSGFCDISHFITTRHGGVSQGTYASMNPGIYTSDDPALVRENLKLLSEAIDLTPERIVMPHQVHKDEIRFIDSAFLSLDTTARQAFLEGVDALVTNIPKICVAVSTADCVPVLLYSPRNRVVAAVHAGWRGTVLRIVQKALDFMTTNCGCDARNMIAGIGPSIGQEAFEVGEEVVDAFREAGFPMDRILRRFSDTGKAHINLWEANRWLLMETGVLSEHIEVAGICTYTHHTDYFSARRLGINSGRILSGIYLNK